MEKNKKNEIGKWLVISIFFSIGLFTSIGGIYLILITEKLTFEIYGIIGIIAGAIIFVIIPAISYSFTNKKQLPDNDSNMNLPVTMKRIEKKIRKY